MKPRLKVVGDADQIPNADTIENEKCESVPNDLSSILRNKRAEYGPDPERVFAEEEVVCARLWAKSLELASTGEHYAAKKYLRAELTKEGKKRNGPNYQGHLQEYVDMLREYKIV